MNTSSLFASAPTQRTVEAGCGARGQAGFRSERRLSASISSAAYLQVFALVWASFSSSGEARLPTPLAIVNGESCV